MTGANEMGQLQITMRRLEATLDAIADAVVWVSPDGMVLWGNSAFATLVGRSPAEIAHEQITDLLPLKQVGQPLSRQAYPHTRLFQGAYGTTHYELDGGDRACSVRINGQVVEEPEGEAIAILTIWDKTLSQQQEEELRRSEARYRSMFENATQGIFQTTPDGYCINANPALAQIVGVNSLEELMNNPKSAERDMYVDSQRRREFLRLLDEEGSISNFESQVYREDGTIIWICESARVVKDEAGNPLYYEGFVEDITERKRVQEALQQSELKFRTIVESANDIIYVIDSSGRFTYMSPNVTPLLGYTATEMEGKPFTEFIHPDDLIPCLTEFRESADQQGKRSGLEFRPTHKNGGYRWVSANVSSICDPDGRILHMGIARDITERKQAEKDLEEQVRLAAFRAEVGSALVRSDCLQTILQRCTEAAVNHLGAAFARIWTYNRDEDVLELQASAGLYTRLDGAYSRVPRDKLPSIVPSLINDVTTAAHTVDQTWVNREGLVAMATYPLLLDQELMGKIVMFSRQPLSELTLQALEFAAREIALGVRRKQAETALESSLSLLSATFESIADGIMATDCAGMVISYNQKFLDMWSLPVALLTDPDRRLTHIANQLKHPEGFIERVKELYAMPEGDSYDLQELTDGRVIERYSNTQRMGDRIIGRVWSFRDITDIEQTQAALRTSEAKFRNLFENSQVGIFRSRIDDDLILDANQRFAELLGYASADEVIGTVSLEDSYLGAGIHQWVVNELLQQGELQSLEMQYRQRDGSLHWGLYSLRLNREDQCIEGVVTCITGRKQAEAALRQQQEFLRTVIDTDPSYIFVKDWNGRYMLANRSAAEFYNLTVEELMGKCDADFHPHADEVNRFVTENRRVIETGEELFIPEEKITTAAFQDQWVQWQKRPLQLPGSDTIGVLGIGVNITDRKGLEAELQQSQQFLDNIINNIPFAIFVKEVHDAFRYVLINKTSERILNFPQEQGIGLNDYDLVPGERADRYHEQDLQVIAQGSILECPDEWVDIDDQERLLLRGWKLPLFDTQGNPTHILAIAEDITERHQREQALRLIMEGTAAKTGNAFFRACVRHLAAALGVRYALVSEFLSETSKRARTLALWGGEAFTENVEYDLTNTPCENVLRGTSCYYPEHLQILFPDDPDLETIGAESYLGVPLLNSSDQVLGHLAVMDTRPMEPDPGREVILRIFAARAGAELERNQAEVALRVAKEAAEAANRAKSAFLANMSHELRTPLNAILGFAQLMERDTALTPRQRESLGIINRSGEHLLDLINDVLEMSKIEAGRTILNPAPFNLHHLLETIQDLFQLRAAAKHLSLQCAIAPDLPQSILTDEGKLRQVLINLLSNAVKFTEQGSVTLRAWVEDSPQEESASPPPASPCTLYFEVEDTGRGIASDEIEQLFQPFVQAASSKQMKEGTGLGLVISRQFVHLMGGEIDLTSAVNKGSIFRFYIQATPVDASTIRTSVHRQPVISLAPDQPAYRILVVDDRLENRELIHQLLTEVGFETRMAVDGLDAIAQWQTWHPHLIWMDMRMPVMDGYAATRQIRQQEAAATPQLTKTIIIALTASAFEEQRTQILAAGCDDLVRKPFKEPVIFEKMAAHLGVRYGYRELDPMAAHQGQRTTETWLMAKVNQLQAADLLVMSDKWIGALRQAAIAANADRLLQLIEQIPEIHEDLANALTDLVHQANFNQIHELT